jgi:hypothetical protein
LTIWKARSVNWSRIDRLVEPPLNAGYPAPGRAFRSREISLASRVDAPESSPTNATDSG